MQHTHERVSDPIGLEIYLASNSIVSRCGGAIGIYFLVERCSLLYLFAGNGAFVQAPYLDVHGEMDMSMRYACCGCSQGIYH